MTQRGLFDAEEGKRRRDASMEQADAAAEPDWKDRALDAIYKLAATRAAFCAEDVWEFMEKPREPRALGPVMMRAVRLGYCDWRGDYRLSRMASHHAAPVRVYNSLVWNSAVPQGL